MAKHSVVLQFDANVYTNLELKFMILSVEIQLNVVMLQIKDLTIDKTAITRTSKQINTRQIVISMEHVQEQSSGSNYKLTLNDQREKYSMLSFQQ